MPRLRNEVSKVVVSVSDEVAALLDSSWVDADKTPRSETPDSSWKVAELKAHAEKNSIDLGEATKKDDILAVISAASGTPADPDED